MSLYVFLNLSLSKSGELYGVCDMPCGEHKKSVVDYDDEVELVISGVI